MMAANLTYFCLPLYRRKNINAELSKEMCAACRNNGKETNNVAITICLEGC